MVLSSRTPAPRVASAGEGDLEERQPANEARSSPSGRSPPASRALWPLPLACALVGAVAVHAAWALSRHAGLIPDCNPYLEGCTSISRAARHGSGNVLFKVLMLPGALLQGLHWWLTARWVDAQAVRHGAARSIRPLAVVAGVALAVYVATLGTEGWLYGWMRRYGITFYFAASFLAMVAFLAQLRATGAQPGLSRAMTALALAMLGLGLVSTFTPLLATEVALVDRVRNVLEWHLGTLFTAWFLLHAALWQRLAVRG